MRTSGFLNVLNSLLMLALAALMSGCAVVGAVAVGGVATKDAGLPSPVVEVGEVKTKPDANVVILKTAKLSSAVFEKDMATLNTAPDQTSVKVNAAVANELKRSIGIPENAVSPATVRLRTYFGEINPWGWSGYYYWNVTERNTLTYSQVIGVKKLVNTHLLLEQGDNTLLEVRGLWVGDDQADEIAGSRQLAREIASEVLKKLSASPAPSKDATAERDAAIALDK